MDGVDLTTHGGRTHHIRKWVNSESVSTVSLGAELLAWYHFVVEGLDPSEQMMVMEKAAALHRILYDD